MPARYHRHLRQIVAVAYSAPKIETEARCFLQEDLHHLKRLHQQNDCRQGHLLFLAPHKPVGIGLNVRKAGTFEVGTARHHVHMSSNVECAVGEHSVERRRIASARPRHCHVKPQSDRHE